VTGTNSAVAVREHGALAIETGQTRWTEMQEAAFGQLGIADAPEGDKGVFLHVSQRTGLDPFSKQIYMIPRWDYQAKKNKYTIQTGIEGFRVMRSRAERIEGVRGILSRPVYYDGEGKEFPVWFFQRPPVAVEMTFTVRDRNGIETPYTSILRFSEYAQTRKDGDQQVLSGQWATKPTHMLEKCVEADVYRKAFPQDFSGVQLDDAMPPAKDPEDMTDEELDAAARAVGWRPRVTAAQARERRTQSVASEVVDVTPNAASGDTDPAPAPEAAQAPEDPTTSGASSSAHAPASASPQRTAAPSPSTSGGSARTPEIRVGSDSPGTVTDPQLKAIWTILGNVFKYAKDEKDAVRDVLARIVGHDLTTTTMLSFNEAGRILDNLDAWRREAADAAANPRRYLDLMTAPQAAQDGAEGE